jgi:DNA transposition AAA+ family ATPase
MHPWNIDERTLQDNTPQLNPTERRELLWAYNYSQAKGLSYPEFGAAAGISGDTLRKLANGTYVDPRDANRRLGMPDSMPGTIAALRESIARLAPAGVQYVFTETSRRTADNCNLARESGSPVFLQGASHIGKTTALSKYRDTRPHDTWLVTVTSGMGAKGLAVAICEELGISASGSLATLTRRIGRAIPKDGLLIVDDFHVLTLSSTPRTFLAAMEFLRAVYDVNNCGMLFSTTDLDYTKIQKDFRNALHQLMRRGVHKPHLGSQPQQKDVRAIIEAHGLKWPARSLAISNVRPWQILANLAAESGLKVITERLRYALRISARQCVPVTWDHFILADTAIIQNSEPPPNDWAA